jgi:hypothetical protein
MLAQIALTNAIVGYIGKKLLFTAKVARGRRRA